MAAVHDNKALSRFEMEAEGEIAFANYRLAPGKVIITHTETPRALRGRGIASELVKGALNLIRADGHRGTDLLEAILSVMPLDDFVPDPVVVMQVVGDASQRPPVVTEYERIVARFEPAVKVTSLERFAFYKRANAGYAMVQTGEQRLYGNIILKKGVIRPDA